MIKCVSSSTLAISLYLPMFYICYIECKVITRLSTQRELIVFEINISQYLSSKFPLDS